MPPLGSESSIELVLRKLQKHIHSSLDVPLSMVLSEIHISHAEFFDAYREASETWEYNLLIGEAGTVRQFLPCFDQLQVKSQFLFSGFLSIKQETVQ